MDVGHIYNPDPSPDYYSKVKWNLVPWVSPPSRVCRIKYGIATIFQFTPNHFYLFHLEIFLSYLVGFRLVIPEITVDVIGPTFLYM